MNVNLTLRLPNHGFTAMIGLQCHDQIRIGAQCAPAVQGLPEMRAPVPGGTVPYPDFQEFGHGSERCAAPPGREHGVVRHVHTAAIVSLPGKQECDQIH